MARFTGTSIIATLRRSATRRLRDESGAVSVELALVAIAFVALFVGAFDFGQLAKESLRVNGAARAGAQYALQGGQAAAADTSSVIKAAHDGGMDTTNDLNVTARNYCACAGSSGEVGCSTNCGDGKYALMYVEVKVDNDVALLFDYPGIASPQNVASTVTMRVR
jgi:Flp pilus assembly protein TadG